MTTLQWKKKHLKGVLPGVPSRFPAMRDPISSTIRGVPGETEGLFLNYGMFSDSLPYAMFDDYDAETVRELEFDAAVLENSRLRAEFIPELGGRLWSLFDKQAGRELLLDNPELRMGNLAIRNAWFAGGVEWNCGRRGHDAQTASPRFTAVLETDGMPVLRFYEMSRDRLTPFQLDFFLPEDSPFLFVRGRITNPNDEVVPMYWWSNIALPEGPGARVVVPAKFTYANRYEGGNHFLSRIPLPDGEGFDGTRPNNFAYVKDHFYDIPEDSRKYECVFYEDGYGFAHCSTRRLPGRKLFVWGMSQGGRHWQRKLVPEGTPDYLEIQAGLGKTQMECVPMPPQTTWEWLETYGAIQLAPETVFGEWDAAVNAVTSRLDALLPEQRLDALLDATRDTIALQRGKVVVTGSGWGALEELRRGACLATQLDFGTPDDEQRDWLELLKQQTMDDTVPPASWLVQKEWLPLLRQAAPGWKTLYHQGLQYFRAGDYERAAAAIRDGLQIRRNAWLLHALSNILRRAGEPDQVWLPPLVEAARMEPDPYLVKETMKLLVVHHRYREALEFVAALPENLQRRPMLQFLRADALAHTGQTDAAEAIILADGGLELPDLREGETSISELYLFLQQEKARWDGRAFDPNRVQIPFRLDLRMTVTPRK